MINRHEWLKATTQEKDLLPRAIRMAVALWRFANDETAQLNPSLESLCDASGLAEDTARRALADLEKAGWLSRTVGRGRCVKSLYVLLSPGNVVTLRPASAPKKVANKVARTPAIRSHASKVKSEKKGSTRAALRSHRCNPLYKDEQTLEQKSGDRPRPDLAEFVEAGRGASLAWNNWLSDHGLPLLSELKALHVKGGYCLPYPKPPMQSDEWKRRIAMKIIEWAKGRGNAHAA